MNIFLISLICCITTALNANQTPTDYATEISQYTKTLAPDTLCYPTTPCEKMFHDIFSMATLPYTQPIHRLPLTQYPSLSALMDRLSTQYEIKTPMLFLANAPETKHIDIKLCVFNKISAILIHPTTVTALTPRVFDRYIEQAFMRIATNIHAYNTYLSTQHKKGAMYASISGVLIGCATALITYCNKEPKNRWITGTSAGILAAGYGALLYHLFKKKHAGFSFQRISSFHNTEQAREDCFPPLDTNQQPTFTADPSALFGLDAVIQTQEYLRARNAQFCELEKLDLEKNEEPSTEDSYYQKLELLRQKINPPHSKRKKSNQ
jgi:hypothetical protein